MTKIDCDTLRGRRRDICRGHDDAGEPISLAAERREAYLRRWFPAAFPAEVQPLAVDDGPPRVVSTRKGRKCCGRKKLRQKAVSFAKSMMAWAADKGKLATPEQFATRMAICNSCPVREGARCGECTCFVQAKARIRNQYCPLQRWHQHTDEHLPFDGEPRKNVIMHLLPVSNNGAWQRQAQSLIDRMELFNGKRVIAVMTPGRGDKFKLDSVADVQAAFAGARIDEWIIGRNNPKLGEVVSFRKMMEVVRSEDPNEVTLYCHGKGVTHAPRLWCPHRWADLMWETVVDNWDVVRRALEDFPVAGSFKRYGAFPTPGNHRWHYSGTFYWFRHRDVFTRPDWHVVDRRYYGTESWPGRMWPAHRGACLFLDDCGEMYLPEYWDQVVYPAIEKWRAARGVQAQEARQWPLS